MIISNTLLNEALLNERDDKKLSKTSIFVRNIIYR